MEDLFYLLLHAAMVVLGLVLGWRTWLTRSEARRRKPVRSRVLSAEREEVGGRTHSWVVETRYDVPGHGVLTHRRGFPDEGPALLFQRLRREGSEHDVIPNLREPGTAFLPDDLRHTDWPLLIALVIASGLATWTAWWVWRGLDLE